GTEWDEAEVGAYSTALGAGARASGYAAFAAGFGANATGTSSAAFGYYTRADGSSSFAAGTGALATGKNSVAIGGEFTPQGGVLGVLAGGAGAIAIGSGHDAAGPGSLALGTRVSTTPNASGSFVFGDRSSVNQVVSYFPNEFLVRAAGGATFYSNAGLTLGVKLAAGATAWSSLSDVNRKEHFRDLDGETVLARIAAMPVREWSYKDQDGGIRHIGPTAQDFHAAFGLGEDPLRISTIDADGVALAAVRALEARTRAYEARLQALERELAAHRAAAGEPR
ncbi:MAG: tail fiber domain-containing protein, partial [Vicinamibacterales bacterium]